MDLLRPPVQPNGSRYNRTPAPRRAAQSAPLRVSTSRAQRHMPSPHQRLRRFMLAATAVVVLLIGMLFKLQVVEPQRYLEKGQDQRQVRVPLAGLRGSMVDRNGETLAMSIPARAIVADPRHVAKDTAAEANQLASVLGIDPFTVQLALERPDTGYSYVARQRSADDGEAVRKLRLPGITVVEETRRVNAAEDLAMAVVGRMDRYGERSMFGLEKTLNSKLKGRPGMLRYERGSDGATIVGSERTLDPPQSGDNITLTIDRSMQFWTEAALAERVAATGASGGTCIVGRPGTGEILAMANMVNVANEGVRSSKLNIGVRRYEPGSVMKMVTAATAFEDKKVALNDVMPVEYSIKVGDKTIHDSHRHPTKFMSVADIIAESSNVGTVKIQQKIGKKRLVEELADFGFGRPTSLDLFQEQGGVLHKNPNDTDAAVMATGQAITVTPLQIFNAYNTVANRGVWVEPRLVLSERDAQGVERQVTPKPGRRVISADTAIQVTQALQRVVEEGTGQAFAIPGYTIAGKTGTSYQVIPGQGYGSDGNRHYAATFAGFFPATDPQLTIVVMLDNPKAPNHSGAKAAGPVFERVAREGMRRYGIAGDTEAGVAGRPVRAQPAVVAAPPPPTPVPVETPAATTETIPIAAPAAAGAPNG